MPERTWEGQYFYRFGYAEGVRNSLTAFGSLRKGGVSFLYNNILKFKTTTKIIFTQNTSTYF